MDTHGYPWNQMESDRIRRNQAESDGSSSQPRMARDHVMNNDWCGLVSPSTVSSMRRGDNADDADAEEQGRYPLKFARHDVQCDTGAAMRSQSWWAHDVFARFLALMSGN